MANPLVELQKLGQSIWYDNIRRSMLQGDLQDKIANDDLRGVTSNPAIFEKAIAGSTDYNEALDALAREGKRTSEIYEIMAVEDIQNAADILKPIYDRTDGVDGYISFEVSPELAFDTEGTITDAKRLWAWIDRPNVMIKIPATPEGLPAITEVLGSGINVNVTLIFSEQQYLDVADAYMAGLEKWSAAGNPIDRIQSVASFFVSRIDGSVDKELEYLIRRAKDGETKAKMESLVGNIAIANAKSAYQKFIELDNASRFSALREKGAKPQRILWASTGTKNPAYKDSLYVESLIGPATVNTVPPATYTAMRDHGEVRGQTLVMDVDVALQQLRDLAEVGVNLDEHTTNLLAAAVKAFVDPFVTLFDVIEKKRTKARQSIVERQAIAVGSAGAAFEATLSQLDAEGISRRIWRKDASVWKDDAEHAAIISNALGWLSSPEVMLDNADDLTEFAGRVSEDGFKAVVLLGMGGSSLCPEVFRRTFGEQAGSPTLHVLDSTDPATVKQLEDSLDLATTLFIVASKSGSTTEPLMFQKYFYDRVKSVKGDSAGQNFVAITDPGSMLEQIAKDDGYRRIFKNMADIGGRYSAISYFGMVPAALQGIDVKDLLERAFRASQACERTVPCNDNPGLRLGAALGTLAKAGRDKVTFVVTEPISSLGLWIEQLIAESTGKEGTGILPVAGEPLGAPSSYGDDRVFAYITTEAGKDADTEAKLDALQEAGHPVIRHVMADELSLGREFFLWEFATAVAGHVIGINPFDQPNVQESKDNTKALIETWKSDGGFPSLTGLSEDGNCSISCSGEARGSLSGAAAGKSGGALASAIGAHMDRIGAGDYVALTAYLPESDKHDELLEAIRVHIRDSLKVATTVGYGPRFLHSTGQLHKGGGDNGVFLQITISDAADVAIPGEPFSFGVLKQAQALGDFQSLASRNRRAVNFHINGDVTDGLGRLLETVREAVGATA